MTWSSYNMIFPGESTDTMFTNTANPPQIGRVWGRFFGGECADHGGQTDGNVTGGSWLQGFSVPALPGVTIDNWDYFEDLGRTAWVTTGGIGAAGVARPSDLYDALGQVAVAINYGYAGKNAWGLYVDGVKADEDARTTHGAEIEIANLPGTSPEDGGRRPYGSLVDGQTFGLALGAGSDENVFGRSYAVDAGLEFRPNGAAFWTGINFRFNAIMREGVSDDTTTPGNSGYARAISLANEHGLTWYSRDAQVVAATSIVADETYVIQSVGTTDFTLIGAASNTVGVSFVATGAGTGTGTASIAGSQAEAVRLYSAVTDPDVKWRAEFNDTAFVIGDRETPEYNAFIVAYDEGTESGVAIVPGTVGQAATIEARGAATNINLVLKGKGTGVPSVPGLATYANNAAALSGGLSAGNLYIRSGHGLDVVT